MDFLLFYFSILCFFFGIWARWANLICRTVYKFSLACVHPFPTPPPYDIIWRHLLNRKIFSRDYKGFHRFFRKTFGPLKLVFFKSCSLKIILYESQQKWIDTFLTQKSLRFAHDGKTYCIWVHVETLKTNCFKSYNLKGLG